MQVWFSWLLLFLLAGPGDVIWGQYVMFIHGPAFVMLLPGLMGSGAVFPAPMIIEMDPRIRTVT
jgi:hypothetical protein